MKKIPLTQGQVALVDDHDFEELSKFRWCAHKKRNGYYAVRCPMIDGKQKMVQMHRVIFGVTDPKILIDHADGNPLNNCRDNLRVCNHSENGRNQGKQKNNRSGYKGVFWDKRKEKWGASIRTRDRRINLGYFSTAELAAKAYNEAAKEHHKQFAKMNPIP